MINLSDELTLYRIGQIKNKFGYFGTIIDPNTLAEIQEEYDGYIPDISAINTTLALRLRQSLLVETDEASLIREPNHVILDLENSWESLESGPFPEPETDSVSQYDYHLTQIANRELGFPSNNYHSDSEASDDMMFIDSDGEEVNTGGMMIIDNVISLFSPSY